MASVIWSLTSVHYTSLHESQSCVNSLGGLNGKSSFKLRSNRRWFLTCFTLFNHEKWQSLQLVMGRYQNSPVLLELEVNKLQQFYNRWDVWQFLVAYNYLMYVENIKKLCNHYLQELFIQGSFGFLAVYK